jgi:dsRNA-specific ribonuclease
LIGANLHDNGTAHANKFIIDFIATYLQSIDLLEIWDIENPAQVLEQILKNSQVSAPEARLLRESGVNTITPCYLVGFYSDQQLLGSGPGESIEQATEMAAYESLRRIFALTNAQTLFKYGKAAYDLNYETFSGPSVSLQDWTISQSSLLPLQHVRQARPN